MVSAAVGTKLALLVGVDRNRRTFPRIPLSEPGLLEFTPGFERSDETLSSRGQRRITVMISSVACEGMRLSRLEPVDDLKPGSRVNVRLHVDSTEVLLPGQVAWLVTANTGETHIGVSLWLEAAPTTCRRAWARWIVNTTDTELSSQRAS